MLRKKLVILAACLVLIQQALNSQTTDYSSIIKTDTVNVEKQFTNFSIDIHFIEIKAPGYKSLEKKINTIIAKYLQELINNANSYKDEDGSIKLINENSFILNDFDPNIPGYIKKIMELYKIEDTKDGQDSYIYSDGHTCRVSFNQNNILSLCFSSYLMRYGGAHGTKVFTSACIDLKKGSEIGMKDMFTQTNYNRVLKILNDSLYEQIFKYLDFEKQDTVLIPESYYIEEGDFCAFYGEDSYAVGELIAKVPLEILKPYLKKNSPLYRLF